jgi:hypothetical protein
MRIAPNSGVKKDTRAISRQRKSQTHVPTEQAMHHDSASIHPKWVCIKSFDCVYVTL